MTLVQIARLRHDQRHQILPAYTQDGIVLARVFQGSTDTTVFEDFIEQLLHHCGRWPEPKSVLVMDNASFHHSARIEQLCDKAGVKLLYLPPYSPDLNPIEEFLAELKTFIKRNWHCYTDTPRQDFKAFLE
jgi:transposase